MMSAKTSRLRLRLVLVLALLLAEWHTFAHAVGHKLHPDDKTRFICIAADHLSHNVNASQTSLQSASFLVGGAHSTWLNLTWRLT